MPMLSTQRKPGVLSTQPMQSRVQGNIGLPMPPQPQGGVSRSSVRGFPQQPQFQSMPQTQALPQMQAPQLAPPPQMQPQPMAQVSPGGAGGLPFGASGGALVPTPGTPIPVGTSSIGTPGVAGGGTPQSWDTMTVVDDNPPGGTYGGPAATGATQLPSGLPTGAAPAGSTYSADYALLMSGGVQPGVNNSQLTGDLWPSMQQMLVGGREGEVRQMVQQLVTRYGAGALQGLGIPPDFVNAAMTGQPLASGAGGTFMNQYDTQIQTAEQRAQAQLMEAERYEFANATPYDYNLQAEPSAWLQGIEQRSRQDLTRSYEQNLAAGRQAAGALTRNAGLSGAAMGTTAQAGIQAQQQYGEQLSALDQRLYGAKQTEQALQLQLDSVSEGARQFDMKYGADAQAFQFAQEQWDIGRRDNIQLRSLDAQLQRMLGDASAANQIEVQSALMQLNQQLQKEWAMWVESQQPSGWQGFLAAVAGPLIDAASMGLAALGYPEIAMGLEMLGKPAVQAAIVEDPEGVFASNAGH